MGCVSVNERSRHKMNTEVQLQNTGKVIDWQDLVVVCQLEFLPNGKVAWSQQHLTPRHGLLNWVL